MDLIRLKFQEMFLSHWSCVVPLVHNLSELFLNPVCHIADTMWDWGFSCIWPSTLVLSGFWLTVLACDSWSPTVAWELHSSFSRRRARAAQPAAVPSAWPVPAYAKAHTVTLQVKGQVHPHQLPLLSKSSLKNSSLASLFASPGALFL